MERVKRAKLGNERFEGVQIFRNSGHARPELRNCFFGDRVAGVRLAPNPCLPYGNPYGVRILKIIIHKNHDTILGDRIAGVRLAPNPCLPYGNPYGVAPPQYAE